MLTMLLFVFLQSYSFHTFHSYTFGILIPCIHEYSFRNTQNKHTCNSTELHVCAKKEKSTFRYSKRKKVTITSTPPQPITSGSASPYQGQHSSKSIPFSAQIYTILSIQTCIPLGIHTTITTLNDLLYNVNSVLKCTTLHRKTCYTM